MRDKVMHPANLARTIGPCGIFWTLISPEIALQLGLVVTVLLNSTDQKIPQNSPSIKPESYSLGVVCHMPLGSTFLNYQATVGG